MSTLNNYLVQLQKLTQTNLDLLTAVNGALKGDSTSTKVEINGKSYDIPSFVSLENKVNSLQETINNIVYAPNTGEAMINMTGNSRIIEIRGYTHTPNSLILNTPKEFGVESNNIFKDFLTPIPYLAFDLSSIPNDVTSVNIKKIIPKNNDLYALFASMTSNGTVSYKYADLLRFIKTNNMVKDRDYIEYDTVKKLPIRKNIGQGEYIVKSVINDYIDDSLIEHIVVQLDGSYVLPTNQENTMTYVRFDGTLETYLIEGDRLVTYDDGAKLEIEQIDYNSQQMTLKVLYGEYLNLIGTDEYLVNDESVSYSSVSNISKLKFFSPINFDADKVVNVPLEEDRYVYIAISPLNDRMNIQAGWGQGVMVDTDRLNRTLSDGSLQNFREYYQQSVNNIGDCLNELTSMMPGELTKFPYGDFETFISIAPEESHIVAEAVQINKHLNDSPIVKSIRTLYNQKTKHQQELNDLQTQIADYNDKLASISINDTTGTRNVLSAQVKDLNNKRNELSTALTNVINQIATTANTTHIPTTDAKYHIRGFFDINAFESLLEAQNFKNVKGKIRGIEVQYRYKNENSEDLLNASTNIQSIGNFTYSEWEVMNSFVNPKEVSYNEGYKFNFQADNSNQNEPSFNQIDIPISQGEVVEMKLRVIYDYGYPFVKICSEWSPILRYTYPVTALTEVSVKSIVEGNNSDIESNKFENILNNNGVNAHIEDNIIDQDITYYHKPENIASGFYTSERRIIPLKDKLDEMNKLLVQLQDELRGSNNVDLDVTVSVGDIEYNIKPNQSNNVCVESYDQFQQGTSTEGGYTVDDNGYVKALLNLNITNKSSQTANLYPLFPGSKDDTLQNLQKHKYDINEYIITDSDTDPDVVYKYQPYLTYRDGATIKLKEQSPNQFLTFRAKDVWNGEVMYGSIIEEIEGQDPTLNFTKEIMPGFGITTKENGDVDNGQYEGWPTFFTGTETKPTPYGSVLYPYIQNKESLVIPSSGANNYRVLSPNETISIPLMFEYKLEKDGKETSKTISFDLRTSLYNDPISYNITAIAKFKNTAQDRLLLASKKQAAKYKTLT